jgi:hypothetical protein
MPLDAATYEDDPSFRDDERLAWELLVGFETRNTNNQIIRQYFDPGSNIDMSARTAMARVLRGTEPLHRNLRDVLAQLFDPQDDTPESSLVKREIRFTFRSRGRQQKWIGTNLDIATYIVGEILENPKTLQKVIKGRAMDRFGLSHAQVLSVWRQYSDLFEPILERHRQTERMLPRRGKRKSASSPKR